MIDAERFVLAIVLGGLALIAGLWTVELGPSAAVRWAGIALVGLGVVGIGWGIWSPLSVDFRS